MEVKTEEDTKVQSNVNQSIQRDDIAYINCGSESHYTPICPYQVNDDEDDVLSMINFNHLEQEFRRED